MRVRSRRAQESTPGKGEDAPRDFDGARVTAETPLDGRWLVRGKDGRLTAYARNEDGLLRWTEERPGGPGWEGPEFFPVPALTHLGLAQGADGYVHFVGRRVRDGADGTPRVDLVHAIQYQTGRPVTAWRTLGNPYKDGDERAARIGPPAAGVARSGRVHVFVRNANGGMMMRREGTNGKWEAWKDLKGTLGKETMAVMVTEAGRFELLVPGTDKAMRWAQSEPGAPFLKGDNLNVRIAGGAVTVLETASDRTTYYWTDAAEGTLVANRLDTDTPPITIGDTPAEGPVAALRAELDDYDCTVLAHRVRDGRVLLAACGTENEAGGLWWAATGERTAAPPALALDGLGRVVLAVIGERGGLYVSRQNSEPGLALGPARRV
ncbi:MULTISPECIES: hypothetical protein [unclassified Streptomyces]|uniref:hypothetical protein n=1 Tax=unclassified Streptomyces TaxID=2593676 RepID=UPI002ED0A4E1|nr:hypothetical protein OH827_27020 [Streptomyces sp. NBC_00891]WSY08441.1 hypothetical protein OG464_27020 [Streptomyces sp. NBC_00890]WSZ10064.1 hypothetical protein OG704_27025 [Streptomyces sp. NBC_00869]WSZ22433.1 hypothetical protein OG498_06545 [Streptomyces sp. NBC_00870]